MATVINMPRLSDTMTEGVVAKWHVKVGDKISEGTLLAEIETDKATMDFEAFPGQEGTLLFAGIDEGASAPVDSILAILGEEGEDISSYMSNVSNVSESKESREDEEVKLSQATPLTEKTSVETPEEKEELNHERLKASPLAKSLAKEKGIDITDVRGTGEGGRIIKRDVESYQVITSVSSVAKKHTRVLDIPMLLLVKCERLLQNVWRKVSLQLPIFILLFLWIWTQQ